MSEKKTGYKNGYWIWNDTNNGLLFVSREKEPLQRLHSGGSTSSKRTSINPDVGFRDTLGTSSQTKFRKYYQRKVKSLQMDVVTLQDVKDVALYTCNLTILSFEFISYFHTKAMDIFLRSAIIYFQYYFQVWNCLQQRRTEVERTLRHPKVTISENIIRDDLADLRSMMSRNYAVLLTGLGDAHKFHHMNNENNTSLSDKDRRLFEMFVLMTGRVIWIALKRKYMAQIETELNRLLRTTTFCMPANVTSGFRILPEDNRILRGKNCRTEQKLLQRSPLIQEIIFQDHDFRMLSIGVSDMGIYDPRQDYLEAAYTAPEDLLEELNIGVGILGVPRRYLTAMLKPKEISTIKKRDSIMKPTPEFYIPAKHALSVGVAQFPEKKTCRYRETKATQKNRQLQCKLWKEHVKNGGNLPIMAVDLVDLQSLIPSYTTLRASAGPANSKNN